ncbi:MAG: hypothetical protein V1745_03215 [Patescibacteria group bacterium]
MPIVKVSTSQGSCRVAVSYPFGGKKVFIATEPHVLRRGDRAVTVPAGVAYLYNSELDRRTKGRVKHLLFKGAYDLLRAMQHICIGTSVESSEIIERRTEIIGAARFLLQSGIVTKEEYTQVLDTLRDLSTAFAPPKRLPEKLAASDRLRKARDLRASGDGRGIAQAAMTAGAARKQIDKRSKSLSGIGGYFSACAIRICTRIREDESRLAALWKFFGDATPAAVVDCEDLIEGIHLADDDLLRRIVRKSGIRAFADDMRRLECRPYRSVAFAIADHLTDLESSVMMRDVVRARVVSQEIRGMLRQLRMVGYLETMLIGRISFYLDRVPADQQDAQHPTRKEIQKRFERVSDRVQEFGPDDLDEGILLDVLSFLDQVRKALVCEDLKAAKEFLKDMTATLARLPVLSDPGELAARAS